MPAPSRVTRSSTNTPDRAKPAKKPSTTRPKAKKSKSAEESVSESEASHASDEFEDPGDESDAPSLNSDALDDESDVDVSKSRKRKRGSPAKATRSKTNVSPKRRKSKKEADSDGEDEEDADFDLKEGQQVVGVVVHAPKTGRVPAGQVSQNTLNFLARLKDPKCNDREWFKLHEPVYRQAEQEWKDFVEKFVELLTDVDNEIPPLPPKDVIHRIYRDVRFSNDKTPYKKSFSASISRSGRKGIFAGYHVVVRAGGESMIAAGTWCPGKNELATIRNNIKSNPSRLRKLISAPSFVSLFGPAKPHPKGEAQNIYGREGELKTAPKGVDKNHRDIDLLKCRSFVVTKTFSDAEVLSPGFADELARVAGVLMPFVHCLNDMMTVANQVGGDDDGSGEEDGGDGDDDE